METARRFNERDTGVSNQLGMRSNNVAQTTSKEIVKNIESIVVGGVQVVGDFDNPDSSTSFVIDDGGKQIIMTKSEAKGYCEIISKQIFDVALEKYGVMSANEIEEFGIHCHMTPICVAIMTCAGEIKKDEIVEIAKKGSAIVFIDGMDMLSHIDQNGPDFLMKGVDDGIEYAKVSKIILN